MGYFEGLVEVTLKKDKDDNAVFYLWGIFGKGRVITDSTKETQLRRFLLRYYMVALPVAIIFSVLRIWPLTLLVVGALTAWYVIASHRLISDTLVSDERLTLKESYGNSAAKHNKFTLWILFIASLLFGFGGASIALKSHGQTDVAFGLGCAIFFGLCSLAIGYMLRVNVHSLKIKSKGIIKR